MKKKELKKHSAVIHCANSLTLLQRKISNALLYHAYPNLNEVEEHEITIDILCKILGVTTRNYEALKNALRALVQTVLEWNVVNDDMDEEDWTATTILASVSIKNGLCYYAYSPRMRNLLHSPSIYGKINLIVQSRFKSSYGLALYENCARYRGLPGTKAFAIDEFRKLMGVPEEQYKVFRDFKRRVIEKAVDEINTYSDIKVEPEIRRAGRKVVSVKFLIKERPKMPAFKDNSKNSSSEQQEHNIIKHQLTKDFGVNPQVSESLISEFSTEYLQEKINLVLVSAAFKKGTIKDVAGYLVSAIKKNYQQGQNSISAVANKHKANYIEAQRKKSKESQEEELTQRYGEYQREQFFNHYEALNSGVKETLLGAWINNLKEEGNFYNGLVLKAYKESEFTSPKVYTSFMRFVKKHKGTYFPKIKTPEEFHAGNKQLEELSVST